MEIYLDFIIICALTLVAGIMSGLTVGLMSIDDLDMEMTLLSGSEQDKKLAKKVLPVISNHHLLLVTLLLANAALTLVLIFGEILPQAFCTGPDQIKIAACMVPIVKFSMCLLYPIAKPIAWLLDKIFRNEQKKMYSLEELKALIQIHTKRIERTVQEYKISRAHSRSIKNNNQIYKHLIDAQNVLDQDQTRNLLNQPNKDKPIHSNEKSNQSEQTLDLEETPLLENESKLIYGALEIRDKSIKQIMKPIEKVFMLEQDQIVTIELVKQIVENGY